MITRNGKKGFAVTTTAAVALVSGGPMIEKAAELMPGPSPIEQANSLDASAPAAPPRRPAVKTQTVCLSEGAQLFTSRARINSTSNGDYGVTEDRLSIVAVVRAPRGRRADYQIRQVLDKPEQSKDLKGKWFTSLNINGSQATISKGKCKPQNSLDATQPDARIPAGRIPTHIKVTDKARNDGVVNLNDVASSGLNCRYLGPNGWQIRAYIDVDVDLRPMLIGYSVSALALGWSRSIIDPSYNPFGLYTLPAENSGTLPTMVRRGNAWRIKLPATNSRDIQDGEIHTTLAFAENPVPAGQVPDPETNEFTTTLVHTNPIQDCKQGLVTASIGEESESGDDGTGSNDGSDPEGGNGTDPSSNGLGAAIRG